MLGLLEGGVPFGDPRGDVVAEIDKELMEILVCPKTKARLVQEGDWLYSTDAQTRLRYPVRDGIPIMLLEEAQAVEQAEFDRVVGGGGRR